MMSKGKGMSFVITKEIILISFDNNSLESTSFDQNNNSDDIVSSKEPSKALLKWYEDATDEDATVEDATIEDTTNKDIEEFIFSKSKGKKSEKIWKLCRQGKGEKKDLQWKLVKAFHRFLISSTSYSNMYLKITLTNCRPLTADMDMFNLIRAPNPTKVKTGSCPCAPHEVPMLTLTMTRVIEMDEPAAATDSSGVPSTIERSSLDFAHEAGASDQGTTAPKMPPSEDVPATVAPGVGQAEETAATDPPAALESHAPVGVSDPDPLSFADAPSRHPVDVAQSSHGIAAAEDPESENASSAAEVGYPKSVYRPDPAGGNGITTALEIRARGKAAEEVRGSEDMSAGLSQELENMRAQFSGLQVSNELLSQQRCAEMDARLDALSIDFDEELYRHMLTAIAGRRWVMGRGLRLAVMKCGESLELRQAFAEVVSAGIAKGLSEGLRHGLEHGQAQLSLESIEAYDPEAKAKFVAALQALKDLKYLLVDQLESLKDAPMDVIMATMYLESDTGDDAPQDIRDLRLSSSQLTIPVYPEVRDPRNPWACKEEIVLAGAITENISRAEKKRNTA
nr:hypothetical protein [Tanacetum cinerariifolium]